MLLLEKHTAPIICPLPMLEVNVHIKVSFFLFYFKKESKHSQVLLGDIPNWHVKYMLLHK